MPGLFKDGVLFTRVELSSRFPNQLSFLAPKDEDFKPLSRDDDFETKTPLTTGSAAAASSSASGKGTGKELVPAAAAASSSESETDSDDSDIAD